MEKMIKAVLVVVLAGWLNSCQIMVDFLSTPNARLRITNLTSHDIDYVSWKDHYGETYYFGQDMVWDTVEQDTVQGLESGSSDQLLVASGQSPLYFYFSTDAIKFRTAEEIEVDADEDVEFTLRGDTDLQLVQSGAGPQGSDIVYTLIPVEGSRDQETLHP